MKFIKDQSYVLKSIGSSKQHMESTGERLIDLGLYPGQKFTVLQTLNSGKVIVIQFEKTILALNELEISCLEV